MPKQEAAVSTDGETAFNEILENVMSRPLGRATAELQRLMDQQDQKLQRLENALEKQGDDLDEVRRAIAALESRLDGLGRSVPEAVTSSQQQLREEFAEHSEKASDAAGRQLRAATADISDALRGNADQLSNSLRDQL